MASPVWPSTSVMAIKINKCEHLDSKSFMVSVRNTKLLEEVFNDHHPGAESDSYAKTFALKSQCESELNSTELFEVENIYTEISPKGKRKLDFPKKTRSSVKLPLTGKTLYLDVKDVKCTRRLEADLRKLGGTIEEFLSKDINYLITSQPRPKVKRDRDDLSPTPSPFNCDPSPSPGGIDDKKLATTTRGKAIAEKARIQTKTTSTLLDNAEKWGIKIVTVEGAFKYINKELQKLPKSPQKAKANGTKIRSSISEYKTFKTPFLKIEAVTHAYKPCTSQLEAWPRLNADTPRGSCPFDGTLIAQDKSREERGEFLAAQVDISTPDTPQEEKDEIQSGARTHTKSVDKSHKKSESDIFASSRLLTAGELRRQKALKKRQERKRGYCECCRVHYDDLDKHCRGDQHREYVRDKSHFDCLDKLIKTVPSPADFLMKEKFKTLEARTKHLRTKCQEEDAVVLIPVSPKSKNKEEERRSTKVSLKPHEPHEPPVRNKNSIAEVSPRPQKSPYRKGVFKVSPKLCKSPTIIESPKDTTKLSPKPMRSPVVNGKSPKDSNKSALVDLRKMTPNGKSLMKIVKSPVRLVNAKQDVASKEDSPRTRIYKRNDCAKFEIDEKRSPRKTLNGKCESSPKPVSLESDCTTSHVSGRDNVEKHAGSNGSQKSLMSKKCNEQLKVFDEKQKSNDHINEILKSPVNPIVKSPQRPVQDHSPNSVKTFISVKKTPTKAIQTHLLHKPQNDALRKSPRKSVSDQSIAEKHSLSPIKSPRKSPAKQMHSNNSPDKFSTCSKNSVRSSNKSPGKSVQLDMNRMRKSLNYITEKESLKSRDENEMRERSGNKMILGSTTESHSLEPNESAKEEIMVRSKRSNKLHTCTYVEEKENTVTSKDSAITDAFRKEVSNKEKRQAYINLNKNCEYRKSETHKQSVLVDIESKVEHEPQHALIESSGAMIGMEIDEKSVDSDAKGNRDSDPAETTHKDLGLSALVELGVKKAKNPTSSDDFERCFLSAISQGVLYHKQSPEDVEPDRILRSKKSLDFQTDEKNDESVIHMSEQADKTRTSMSTDEVIKAEVSENKTEKVEKGNVHDFLINYDKSSETNEEPDENQMLGVKDQEKKLLSPPPDNKKVSEFELPLEIQLEVLFTPTLAERVKTRTRNSNSVTSCLSSPARSRSNSISSINSDSSAVSKNALAAKSEHKKVKHSLKHRDKPSYKHSNCDKRVEAKFIKQKSDSSSGIHHDTVTGTVCNKRDKGMLNNENVLVNSVQNTKARKKWSNKALHSVRGTDRKGHGKRSDSDTKLRKVNSELQSLKDSWNDLSLPSVERLSRSRAKIVPNDGSDLTEDYEYSGKESVDDIKVDEIKSDKNTKKVKKHELVCKKEKQILILNSAANQVNKEENFISSDTNERVDNQRPTIETLDSDIKKKMVQEKLSNIKEGRKSPVFRTSPVSKRRKGRNVCAVNKVSDREVGNNTDQITEKVTCSGKENNHMEKNSSAESREGNVGSRLHSSVGKGKVRISKSIRNSFMESSPVGNIDKGLQNVDVFSDSNSSIDLNSSANESCKTERIEQNNIPEQNTPNSKKEVPSDCYGSGYSSTPRKERRKAWKRKNVNTNKDNDTSSQYKKRRKLDKLKFVIEDNPNSSGICSANESVETKSPRKHVRKKSKSLFDDKNSLEKEKIRTSKSKDVSIQDKSNKSNTAKNTALVDTENAGKKDLNASFSLKWEPMKDDKNTIKLNKSWALLSSRSVKQLLSSEDDRQSFDGFTEEDIKADTSLASDMSYEECWEVDKSINSEREFEVDMVENKPNEGQNKEEFDTLLPTFSSPGKRSDSSWFDACEVYIDKSVKSTVEPFSVFKGWTSPRKLGLDNKQVEEIYKSPTKSPRTPNRKKQAGRPVSNTVFDREKVDLEIEFNYKSPQKNRHEFSPLQGKRGRVVDSSPQCKTSTPTKTDRYFKGS